MPERENDVARLREEIQGNGLPSVNYFKLWRTRPDSRFFAKTASGRFVAASPLVLSSLGLNREEEIVGHTDFDFSPDSLAEKFARDDGKVIASGLPLTGIRENLPAGKGNMEEHITDKFPILGRDRKVIGVMGTSRVVVKSAPGAASDGMETVMDYLRDHFREEVPMKVLAELVRLSLRQFHRNFKKRFGIPPNQFLIRMRVSAAQNMLLTDNRPISEIAYALGFADDTLFIRQFKARMGMTPLQYRKTKR